MNPLCKICSATTNLLFKKLLIGKYDVQYYQCPSCGFIQTEHPYWLPEVYSNTLPASDEGVLRRNFFLANETRRIIENYFNPKSEYVDYGGGYGLFTRMMRDKGFAFFHDDPLCMNIFARGYEAKKHTPFEMLTTFEVFEHLENPVQSIQEMFDMAPSILFSTELVPTFGKKFNSDEERKKELSEWWYFQPESGQHISFWSLGSLEKIAEKYGKNLYTHKTLHLLTDKKLSTDCLKETFKEKIKRKLRQ